jgi:hypothetical protein
LEVEMDRYKYGVLEAAGLLHGHATGTCGGMQREELDEMAEWAFWRTRESASGGGWNGPTSAYDGLACDLLIEAASMWEAESERMSSGEP